MYQQHMFWLGNKKILFSFSLCTVKRRPVCGYIFYTCILVFLKYRVLTEIGTTRMIPF